MHFCGPILLARFAPKISYLPRKRPAWLRLNSLKVHIFMSLLCQRSFRTLNVSGVWKRNCILLLKIKDAKFLLCKCKYRHGTPEILIALRLHLNFPNFLASSLVEFLCAHPKRLSVHFSERKLFHSALQFWPRKNRYTAGVPL